MTCLQGLFIPLGNDGEAFYSMRGWLASGSTTPESRGPDPLASVPAKHDFYGDTCVQDGCPTR
jgi:hypothetical protein